MKAVTRLLVLTLLLITLLSLAAPALAANTKTYSGSAAPRFGKSVSFYVTTDDSSTHKVKATFAKASLAIAGNYCCSWSRRGSYEAIVYFKNSAGNWQWESQTTCYNTGSKTLTLKKADTDYKIVIRAKDALVVWNSYVKNGIISPCSACQADANGVSIYWKVSAPTVKLSSISGGGTGNISKTP